MNQRELSFNESKLERLMRIVSENYFALKK